MGTVRFTDEQHRRIHAHLYSTRGEHFAFCLADYTMAGGVPVFLVRDVLLIDDGDVTVDVTGWSVNPDRLVAIVNSAVRQRQALIEVHNHGGRRPRFSYTDEAGFDEFVPYVLSSLPGRPYGATVWGDSEIHGVYFLPDGTRAGLDSITVRGANGLQQLASWDDQIKPRADVYGRQEPWFTAMGQARLANLIIAIVGAGGNGSHLCFQLPFLGCRRFMVFEHDYAGLTNMNRLMTATAADEGAPKVSLAEQRIELIAPDARVDVFGRLESKESLSALKRADVIFGCVDNDGPRLLISELAAAYEIPFFDLGSGLDAEDGVLRAAGGRVCVALPGGPCLRCMGEIDPLEARYYFSTAEEKEFMKRQGYVDGMDVPAPSVVSLNGTVASLAASEFAAWVSGARAAHPHTELDLLGQSRPLQSQWVTPRRVRKDLSCVICDLAGAGDNARIEPRYTTLLEAKQ